MVEISDRIWREVFPTEPEGTPFVDEATGELLEVGTTSDNGVSDNGVSDNGVSDNGAFSEADDLPISLDS
jgi:hypothetical protein